MLDINEKFIVCEAQYKMPYHELESIVAFLLNFEKEELPESIRENLHKYQDFLIDNV